MGKFQKNSLADVTVCGAGQKRRILASEGGLMTVELTFETGAGGGALHHHPHRQVSYAISGKFEYTVEDRSYIMEPGDAIMVDPDVPHGCKCLEAGKLMDIFTPERQDFLKK